MKRQRETLCYFTALWSIKNMTPGVIAPIGTDAAALRPSVKRHRYNTREIPISQKYGNLSYGTSTQWRMIKTAEKHPLRGFGMGKWHSFDISQGKNGAVNRLSAFYLTQ
jgi:hypothetical protein